MTATPISTCPAWCDNNRRCDGEHYRHTEWHDYIPASGTVIRNGEDPITIASFGVGIGWNERDNDRVEIILHEYAKDGEWRFELEDAFELITLLLERYTTAMKAQPEPELFFDPAVYASLIQSLQYVMAEAKPRGGGRPAWESAAS